MSKIRLILDKMDEILIVIVGLFLIKKYLLILLLSNDILFLHPWLPSETLKIQYDVLIN